MLTRKWICFTLLWICLLSSLSMAASPQPQGMSWQPTMESAKRLAAQTNRLVLVHFWASWCGACRMVEREVLRNSGVASELQKNFVPVKINADHFPATARHYGVTALPTSIVITPEGRLLEKVQGRIAASDYVARLNRVATASKGSGSDTYARIGSAPPPTVSSQQGSAAGPPPPAANYQGQSYAQRDPTRPDSARQPGPAAEPQEAQRPVTPPQPATRSPANPLLALDGYCPVQLCDDMQAGNPKWTLGNRRWGAIHCGRTYLFAGAEQQQRFLADPDRYAPVISGNDAVLDVDRGESVPGKREHGLLFQGRIYLFASESSLETFSKTPNHYADRVRQAMRDRAGQQQAQR